MVITLINDWHFQLLILPRRCVLKKCKGYSLTSPSGAPYCGLDLPWFIPYDCGLVYLTPFE